MKVVASYDTWILHSFIGVPSSQTDINSMHLSNVFDLYFEWIIPKVTYKVNGSIYANTYYLADGIYPRYSKFAKIIRNPESEAEKLSARNKSHKEGCRDIFWDFTI